MWHESLLSCSFDGQDDLLQWSTTNFIRLFLVLPFCKKLLNCLTVWPVERFLNIMESLSLLNSHSLSTDLIDSSLYTSNTTFILLLPFPSCKTLQNATSAISPNVRWSISNLWIKAIPSIKYEDHGVGITTVGWTSFSNSLPSCALFVFRGKPFFVAKEVGRGPREWHRAAYIWSCRLSAIIIILENK